MPVRLSVISSLLLDFEPFTTAIITIISDCWVVYRVVVLPYYFNHNNYKRYRRTDTLINARMHLKTSLNLER